MKRFMILCLLLAFGVQADSRADEPVVDDQPVEIGLVHWKRDLEEAKKISATTGKPVFVLFQEVPG